jgi:hypothetical protein
MTVSLMAFLVPILSLSLGVFLLVRAFRRRRTNANQSSTAGWVFVLLGICMGLCPSTKTVYDGNYAPVEFRITFIDGNGTPVKGVELRVDNRQGQNFFLYPVTDYLPDRIPTSNEKGIMVFHHHDDEIIFSGFDFRLWGAISIEHRPMPYHLCRFVHGGREVYRISYSELSDWEGSRDTIPHVKVRWRRSGWPIYTFLREQSGVEVDFMVRARQFFDFNRDGELGPEEDVALRAAIDAPNWDAGIARSQGKDPEEEEAELALIEKTVVIQPDKE